jgi:glycerol-3-phosphate acyltransferase PlsY
MAAVDILLIVGAYLLGSLSTAVVVCRLAGLPDPRTEGSKNPGATNVLRLGGKKAAAATLAGDFAKGLVPVLVGRLLDVGPEALAAAAMGAFLGHLYPIFFGFRGGKGVATAFGVLLGLSWPIALASLLTWLAMAKLFRISSLSALVAAVLAPLYGWWLAIAPAYIIRLGAMGLLLIWRHRSNIRNLIEGKESRIGQKG